MFLENKNNRPVTSFYERLADIKERVDFEYICEGDKPLAHECCLIICETLTQSRAEVVRISGEDIDGDMVREIFASLTRDHLEHVIENYKSVKTEIKRKKQYLRSALYNAFFELEAAVVNGVKCAFG
jgi:hypothetical protein